MTAQSQLLQLPAERELTRGTDAVTLLSIYTFLVMIIPSPLAFAPLGGAGGPATVFGALLLIIYLVTLVVPTFTLSRRPQPIRTAAVLLTCAVFCAYVSANRRMLPSSLEQNGADRGLIIMMGWLGVMLVASDGITGFDRLNVLLRRITLFATAISSLAIVQFFTGLNITSISIPGLSEQTAYQSLLNRDGLNRPSATAIDPIELACVLAICLPIAIHRARHAPPGKRLRRWLQVGIIGIAMPMTISRTGIIALVVIGLVMLPTWPKRDRRIALGAGAVGAVVMFATKPGLIAEFGSLFGSVGSDTSSTSRTSAFTSATPFISQHPWFGRGFGTFLPSSYFFTDDQYLLSLLEIGLVGLAALAALFVTGWMAARNARRLSTDPVVRDLAQTLAACVAVPAVAWATFDATSFPMAAGLTFLTLGMIGAVWRLVRTQAPAVASGGAPPPPPPPPPDDEPRPPEPYPDTDISDTSPIPIIRVGAVMSGTRRLR